MDLKYKIAAVTQHLQLTPFNEASKDHVSANGHAVNISIPTKGSKTLAFIAKHYSSKWGGVSIRFHAPQPLGGQTPQSWGPTIEKDVTVETLFKSVLGSSHVGTLTLRYEVIQLDPIPSSKQTREARKRSVMSTQPSPRGEPRPFPMAPPSTSHPPFQEGAPGSQGGQGSEASIHPWSSLRVDEPSSLAPRDTGRLQSSGRPFSDQDHENPREHLSLDALTGLGAESQALLDLLSGPSNLTSLLLPALQTLNQPEASVEDQYQMLAPSSSILKTKAATRASKASPSSLPTSDDPCIRVGMGGVKETDQPPTDQSVAVNNPSSLVRSQSSRAPGSLPAASSVPKPQDPSTFAPSHPFNKPLQPSTSFSTHGPMDQPSVIGRKPSRAQKHPTPGPSTRWIDNPMLHLSGIFKKKGSVSPSAPGEHSGHFSHASCLTATQPESLVATQPEGSLVALLSSLEAIVGQGTLGTTDGQAQAQAQADSEMFGLGEGGGGGMDSIDDQAIREAVAILMAQQYEPGQQCGAGQQEGDWMHEPREACGFQQGSPDSVGLGPSSLAATKGLSSSEQKGENSSSKRRRGAMEEGLTGEALEGIRGGKGKSVGSVGHKASPPPRVVRRKSDKGKGAVTAGKEKAVRKEGSRKACSKSKAPKPILAPPLASLVALKRHQQPSVAPGVAGLSSSFPPASHQLHTSFPSRGGGALKSHGMMMMPPPPPPLAPSPIPSRPPPGPNPKDGYRLISRAFDELSNAMCSRLSLFDPLGFLTSGDEAAQGWRVPPGGEGRDMAPLSPGAALGNGTVGWIEGAAWINPQPEIEGRDVAPPPLRFASTVRRLDMKDANAFSSHLPPLGPRPHPSDMTGPSPSPMAHDPAALPVNPFASSLGASGGAPCNRDESPLWTFSPLVTRRQESRAFGTDLSLNSGLGGEAVDYMDLGQFGFADSLFGPMGAGLEAKGAAAGEEKENTIAANGKGPESSSRRPFAALFE